MGDLRILDFDILGNLPQNKIDREEIPLKDKTCPWIIPNGSPFFASDVRVFNEKGGELKLNRDFFVEQEFVPFCEMTGQSVVSFIRLSDLMLANNSKVFVSYRSIGAWFIPRNDLDSWLEKIRAGNTPLPWEKVFGKITTFPTSYHIHSAMIEIGDWYELSFVFQYLTNIRMTRNADLSTDIDTVMADAYQKLEAKRDEQLGLLKSHDSHYANPHEVTATDLSAGNLLNAPTATASDMNSGSDQFYVTPLLARQRVEAVTGNTDGLLKNGAMPISLLGGGDFIPPTIDGSFEGLGSDDESTGFCLENNGRLMMLTRHFDGRQAALFFSFLDNYKKDPNGNNVIFTGFKYTNQYIAADGIEPDVIIAGSNHKVLMVGKKKTANWYICLTNGTFDPATHSYVKVDMTNVNAKAYGSMNNPVFSDEARSAVHKLGDYVYLIQSSNIPEGNGESGNQYFFRVKVSDLLAGNNVSWEHVKLTYTDFDGVARANFDYYRMLTPVYANNRVMRAGYNFNPGFSSYSGFYRKLVTYSAEHPTELNKASIHICGHMYLTYNETGANSSIAPDIDMAYEFNPVTGVMTLQDKAPLVTFDPNNKVYDQNGNAHPQPNIFGGSLTFATGKASTVLLANGTLLNSNGFDSAKSYPRVVTLLSAPGVTSDWEMCKRSHFTLAKEPGVSMYSQLSVIAGPLKNNTYPTALSYCADGEIFTALNQTDNGRSVFFKSVTGPYQVRDESKLVNYPGALSRPLTNNVYKTNLPIWMTQMTITGPASQLAAAGREMGDHGLSIAKFINEVNAFDNPVFQYAKDGIEHCWPKTHTRQLNPDMTATYGVDRYYGMRRSLLLQLYAGNVPAGVATTMPKGLTIAMFPAENGPMFSNIAIGVMTFVYYTGSSTAKIKVISFKAVIEGANSAHPNVDLITSFQQLAVQEATLSSSILDSSWNGGFGVWQDTMMPVFQGYRDGNNLYFYWYTGFYYPVIGNTNIASFNAVVDLTTGAFSSFQAWTANWLPDQSVRQMIPNVGLTTTEYVLLGSSPSCQICKADDGRVFIMASTYPSPLWSVFFKEGTRVLINGTKYMLPIGIVDLRDIDPSPANKTFYIYVTVDENGAKYIITKNRLRHNNFLLPAATVVCGEKQVLRIDTRQPFMIGDFILQATREGGSIPASSGLPMDEGSFRYIYQHDLS